MKHIKLYESFLSKKETMPDDDFVVALFDRIKNNFDISCLQPFNKITEREPFFEYTLVDNDLGDDEIKIRHTYGEFNIEFNDTKLDVTNKLVKDLYKFLLEKYNLRVELVKREKIEKIKCKYASKLSSKDPEVTI